MKFREIEKLGNSQTFKRLSLDFHKNPKLSRPGKWALLFPKLSQTFPDRMNPEVARIPFDATT